MEQEQKHEAIMGYSKVACNISNTYRAMLNELESCHISYTLKKNTTFYCDLRRQIKVADSVSYCIILLCSTCVHHN